MHRPARTAAATLASLPLLALCGPAQAAEAPWVGQGSTTSVEIQAANPGTLAGHAGNWHAFSLAVVTERDRAAAVQHRVTGGLTDWQCAPGQAPTQPDHTCALVGQFPLQDTTDVVVTVSPMLRYARVSGPVVLDGATITRTARIDLRVRAVGSLARTAAVTTVADPVDPYERKQVDTSRDGTSVKGRFGWVKLNSSITTTTVTALTRSQVLVRGQADAG